LVLGLAVFVGVRIYAWYGAWSAYRDAESGGTMKALQEFVEKYPDSDRCADAAKSGAGLAAEGKFLAEWPDLLRALGRHNCNAAADALREALKFPLAEVRVAASGSLLRLSAPGDINPKQPVKLSDLDPIVSQAAMDPEPAVRANLRCVAALNNRQDLFQNSIEKSPYVLEADKLCAKGSLSDLYSTH
jgi:hypothetical protein